MVQGPFSVTPVPNPNRPIRKQITVQVHPPGTVLKVNTHGELRVVATLDLMEAIKVAQEGVKLLSVYEEADAEKEPPTSSQSKPNVAAPGSSGASPGFRLSVHNRLGRMVYLQQETSTSGRNQVVQHKYAHDSEFKVNQSAHDTVIPPLAEVRIDPSRAGSMTTHTRDRRRLTHAGSMAAR